MRCFKQNERTKCKKHDPARTRTWNLLIRSQTPYPLGHEADKVYIDFYCYFTINCITNMHCNMHPRRPRGSQSGREKRRDESFQVRAEEPLGTDSHRTISKSSSRCWLLIGHKKCFVLLCPIGEHISWVLFVCSYTTAIARLVGVMHQRNARSQETFSLI